MHIKKFREKYKDRALFDQRDIDQYFFNMTEEDEKRDAENKESQATKKARKHALAFYLNHGLSLNLMTKHYSAKSVR
jgi:hypothetical protein